MENKKKISELPAKTVVGNNDQFVFVDDNASQTSNIKFSDLKSAIGSQGATGLTGPTGPTGPGWTGVTYNPSDGKLTFASDDGLEYTTDSIAGETGLTGPPGEKGGAAAGVVYVDDFGAVGDGETDDSLAFQTAIDSFVDWKDWDNNHINYWETLSHASVFKIYLLFRGNGYNVIDSDPGGYEYWRHSGKPNYALLNALRDAEDGTPEIRESLPVINGGCVMLGNKRFAIHQNIYLRPNTTLEGIHENPSFVRGKDNLPTGLIFLKNDAEINITSTASLTKCYVIKHGLVDTPQYTDQNFSGVGIRITDGDSAVTNCFIGGFEYGVYANMGDPVSGGAGTHGGRVRLRNLNMDNTNGIYLRESWDVSYIENVHMWPFLTPAKNPNGNSITEDFYTFRSGVGIAIRGINDWTKITDCFTYGYKIGFEVNKGRNVILKGCGADNTSEYMWTLMGLPNPGNLKVIPDTIGFKLGDNTDVAFDGNSQWGDQFGSFGHPLLTNCQAAAQEIGFQINLPGTEMGQISNSQAWACLTSVKLTGSGSLTVSQSNFDDYKNADWIALHNAGSGTFKSLGNGFRTSGTGNKQETVGNVDGISSPNNSVLTISAQHPDRSSGTEGGHITLNNTGDLGSWNIDTEKVNDTDDKLRIFNYDANGALTWPVPFEFYRDRLELTFGPSHSGVGYEWPFNYTGTRAGLVIKHHDDESHAGKQVPAVMFDLEMTGDAHTEVYPNTDYSNAISWGVTSSIRKYNDGSGHSFSAIGNIYETGQTGYNELASYCGEATNMGSTHATISGVEVRCKDGESEDACWDTKINSVIGRVARYCDGNRQVSSFMASSEGTKRVDTVLTINSQANIFKNGLDLSNADLSEKGTLIMPSDGEIQAKIGNSTKSLIRATNDIDNPVELYANGQWIKPNGYVNVQIAGGPHAEPTQDDVEALGASNAQILINAIGKALVNANPHEVQYPTGVIKLPAGRIYLDRKITITMPATLGHNFPNSLSIVGEGQGNTQLCWTNNSQSQGIEIEMGPYGAIMNQQILVRDLDFILGNHGTASDDSSTPWNEEHGIAVPQNQSEGLLGAKGTALYINAKRTKLGQNFTIGTGPVIPPVSADLGYNRYEYRQGLGHKPSCVIENCGFRSWHMSYAGWDKCIDVEDAQLTDIKSCTFNNSNLAEGGADDMEIWWSSSVAIHIRSEAKATDFFLEHLRFFGFETAVLCEGNVEGVTISQSTWVNTKRGVYWNVQEILNGVDTGGIGQFPLLVLTDCHMNCNEYNVYIQNGWQIIIKGCSFYGINNIAAVADDPETAEDESDDGRDHYPLTHRSVYIGNKSSNVIVTGNTFCDAQSHTSLTQGGYGPSMEIHGHGCLITNNLFTPQSGVPQVLLKGRASANTIKGNRLVGPLAPTNVSNGIPVGSWGTFLVVDESSDGSFARQPNDVIDNDYGTVGLGGPQGPQGDKGDKGDQGDKGDEGGTTTNGQLDLFLQHWEIHDDGHLLPKEEFTGGHGSTGGVDIGSAEHKVRHLFRSDN